MNTSISAIRILGIDPGLQSTGFGVIDKVGTRLTYVASGCIRTNQAEALPQRLGVVFDSIREVIAKYAPHEAAIEEVFLNKNPWSTLLLGQARGAAIAAATTAGLPVAEYGTMQIKKSVVGQGRATKDQVSHMVVRLLSLGGVPQSDAADALACAICHAHTGHGFGIVTPAGGRRRGGRVLPPGAKPLR
ncbi:crossover junction endodeoxyribonuclease RuvC [Niveibacterium sp. 24ML]|uniref:crossover junction endodeoxyribonuclease RuvC n=1 Tax=Niveibacterium sp. 24ML TaxID=2985512 RepID=UPI00227136A2|nr:crossover junction endodeoxyribonuclease RuvC [Niveibacterium sp. 24ML]MCX9154766.1 crossover junction endodeoxyribonuclease RuvC [Niveibacterium sp. 24ML]